jgi:type IV secretion system protein VirB8
MSLFRRKKVEALRRSSEERIPQDFVSAALEFEKLKFEEIKKSRSMAWVVAAISVFVATVGVIGFTVALILRPEPEPMILKVDMSTGATSVMRSVKDTSDRYDEVVNKYWLAHYVRLCEGYDWYMISNDFEACKLMSEPSVASSFAKQVQDPNGPLNVLKDKGKIMVKISSIAFVGKLAQVRFTTERRNSVGDPMGGFTQKKWLATIAFWFNPGMMTEQQRLINPLGFKVASYRVDPEVLK